MKPGLIGTLLLLLLPGCNDEVSSPVPAPRSSSSDDAQLISIILGQTIRPDQDLAVSVAVELDAIRGKYQDEIPEVALGPRPVWAENEILISMTEGAIDSVRQGMYTAWDDLNRLEGATIQWINPKIPWLSLIFDDWINSRLMAPRYQGFPGVVLAYPARRVGDWSNLYPLQREGSRTYLFRKGSGDCLAGCMESEYWYFRAVGQSVDYVGHWKPGYEPQPAWWAEAKENLDYFSRW